VGENARVNRAAVFEETDLGPNEVLVDAIAWREHRLLTER
jgi:hypothetical protein